MHGLLGYYRCNENLSDCCNGGTPRINYFALAYKKGSSSRGLEDAG